MRKIADVIRGRQQGKAIEDVIIDVFETQEQSPAGEEQPVEQTSSVPSAPGLPAGGAETPQEEALEGPGITQQRPELQSLLSSLNASGRVGSSVRTVNRRVVG